MANGLVMTDVVPIFVTRVNLAKGADSVLISLEAPTGEMNGGPIENRELVRAVLSDQTFRQVCELFLRTLRAMDAVQAQSVAAAGRTSPAEPRAFGAAEPRDGVQDDDKPEPSAAADRGGPTTKH